MKEGGRVLGVRDKERRMKGMWTKRKRKCVHTLASGGEKRA